MIAALALTVLSLTPGIPAAVHPCAPPSPYYCGSLRRPLDPSGRVRGTIAIHYEILPRSDRSTPALGTIVANEGGPGSGSTESRDAYAELFVPLLDHRDLLLMDNRGTGKSGLVDCEPLQSRATFLGADVAACGAQLGNRTPLYRTALAADDLAAIMDALGISRADLYGDSYGTFFVQTFAIRHPARVRSIMLDGAYPVNGLSPWYPEVPDAMRRGFDAVCARAPACAAVPGSSIQRLERLATMLRTHPLQGSAPVGDAIDHVSLRPQDLAFVMASAGLTPVVYRELDAAARAYLDDRDPLPLLRLTGEVYAVDEASGSAESYSRGLFTSVSCADDPHAFDMHASPVERAVQWRAALAAKRARAPSLYAPFSIDEWMAMPLDFSYTPLCVDWPAEPADVSRGPVAPGARLPHMPALVISGELDTITPAAQGAATSELLPMARHVVVRNSVHVDALDDDFDCASRIVRHFVLTLAPGDTSCADRVPPITLVPIFAKYSSALPPARAAAGYEAHAALLRVCTAALQTLGDVLARVSLAAGSRGLGLRGGSFALVNGSNGQSVTLSALRFVTDVEVDGSARSDTPSGEVSARLAVSGAASGILTIRLNARNPRSIATITGVLEGQTVHATAPSP